MSWNEGNDNGLIEPIDSGGKIINGFFIIIILIKPIIVCLLIVIKLISVITNGTLREMSSVFITQTNAS